MLIKSRSLVGPSDGSCLVSVVPFADGGGVE